MPATKSCHPDRALLLQALQNPAETQPMRRGRNLCAQYIRARNIAAVNEHANRRQIGIKRASFPLALASIIGDVVELCDGPSGFTHFAANLSQSDIGCNHLLSF